MAPKTLILNSDSRHFKSIFGNKTDTENSHPQFFSKFRSRTWKQDKNRWSMQRSLYSKNFFSHKADYLRERANVESP